VKSQELLKDFDNPNRDSLSQQKFRQDTSGNLRSGRKVKLLQHHPRKKGRSENGKKLCKTNSATNQKVTERTGKGFVKPSCTAYRRKGDHSAGIRGVRPKGPRFNLRQRKGENRQVQEKTYVQGTRPKARAEGRTDSLRCRGSQQKGERTMVLKAVSKRRSLDYREKWGGLQPKGGKDRGMSML